MTNTSKELVEMARDLQNKNQPMSKWHATAEKLAQAVIESLTGAEIVKWNKLTDKCFPAKRGERYLVKANNHLKGDMVWTFFSIDDWLTNFVSYWAELPGGPTND